MPSKQIASTRGTRLLGSPLPFGLFLLSLLVDLEEDIPEAIKHIWVLIVDTSSHR
jgi:hypothetical protein